MADLPQVQDALLRARNAFERKPLAAYQEDTSAVAVWEGGLATNFSYPGLPALRSDLPAALGGEGLAPSPGWFFRAGVASCMATSIAMQAALRGVALSRLEVRASSESDARGMLGIAPGVPPGPLTFSLRVTLEAPGVDEAQLRDLVKAADEHAPMSSGLRRALEVDIGVTVV